MLLPPQSEKLLGQAQAEVEDNTVEDRNPNDTYLAMQATGPGRLQAVRLPVRDPGPDQVRIRVEACGVCHSDAATIEGQFPIEWPRVPGHEVVGRIEAVGADVRRW